MVLAVGGRQARCVETRMLEAVYSAMQLARIEPDSTTYHELLSCYGRCGAVPEAEKLFAAMKQSGVQPDGACLAARKDPVRVF